MIKYQANWERAALFLAVVCAVQFAIVTVLLPLAIEQISRPLSGIAFAIWLAGLFAFLLPAILVLWHSSSTFRIDGEKFVHLRFGRPHAEFPLSELESLSVSAGVSPGMFKFTDGRVVEVSGIALGASSELEAVLAALGIAVNKQDRN